MDCVVGFRLGQGQLVALTHERVVSSQHSIGPGYQVGSVGTVTDDILLIGCEQRATIAFQPADACTNLDDHGTIAGGADVKLLARRGACQGLLHL